ncbi:MAG: universal stress protein [Vampirovibrionales bacterium]|nr:universal stress protein [Vampirovibrionales bacterium]
MKVLIPVDGSECSNATLAWAAQTLDKATAELHLFYVIPRGIPELVTEEYQVEDAITVLHHAQATLKAAGCHVGSHEYAEGDPVQEICDYADAIEADQVLMGSHGRSGLARILLGSVSSGVMEHCRRPVFIYKNVKPASSAK